MNVKQAGRWMGALMLTTLVIGIWNNFVLVRPIFEGVGYLVNGAGQADRFGLAALLGLLTSAANLSVAIIAFPIFRRYSQPLALGYLALTIVGFATSAVEQANFLAMHSLSLQYQQHAGTDAKLFEILRGVVSANRNWIHFIDKWIGGASIVLLHLNLFRARLVPVVLALAGLFAALLQISGMSMTLFSRELPMLMLAPLALWHLLLALWLIVKSLDDGQGGDAKA